MLQHFVLPVLFAFFVYCAGRLLKPLGDFYTTILLGTATVCRAIHQWLEQFTPKKPDGGDENKTPGLGVIARLVGGVIGLAVLAGEFFGSYAASPLLFGSEIKLPPLPWQGLAMPAMAVLLGSLCLVYGTCFMEAVGWIPPEARIIAIPESKRRGFGWFSTTALVLSMIMTALFFAVRPLSFIDPTRTSDLSVALQFGTFLLLGLLFGAASVALWTFVVGLHTFVQLVLGIAAFVAATLATLTEFMARPFSRQLGTKHDEIEVMPARLVTIREEQQSMNINQRNNGAVSLLFAGTFPLEMRSALESTLMQMGGADMVRASSSFHFQRKNIGPTSLGKDKDASLPCQEVDSIREGVRGDRKQVYTELCNRHGRELFHKSKPVMIGGGSVWCFIDRDVLPYVETMLRELRRSMPYHAIVVVTEISESDRRSDEPSSGLRMLRDLHHEKDKETEQPIVTITFVISPTSPFTTTTQHSGGQRKQIEMLAQAIAALIIGESHSDQNRSCVEVLEALGTLSPFASFAFTSEPLSPTPGGWREIVTQLLLYYLRGLSRPVGDFSDMRLQAERVSHQILTNPEYQAAIPNVMLPDRPALLVYVLPLRPADDRMDRLRDALTTFLGRMERNYPHGAVPAVMVRGNGVPMHVSAEPMDEHYVMGCYIFPVAPDFDSRQAKLPTARQERALPIAREASTMPVVDPSQVSDHHSSNGALH